VGGRVVPEGGNGDGTQPSEEAAAHHGSLWEAADTEEAMLQTLLLRGDRAGPVRRTLHVARCLLHVAVCVLHGAACCRLHSMSHQCSDRCGSAAMLCMPRCNAAQACRPKSALREFALDDTPSGSMITSSPTPAPGSATDDASAGNDACKVVIDAQVSPVPVQVRHGASPVPAQMCVRFAQASNGELHVKAATLGGLVALLSSNTMLHWKLLEARCALKNACPWSTRVPLEYQSSPGVSARASTCRPP
jgi:hypothetical protein